MTHTIAYNIRAIDQFTATSKKVRESFLKMAKAADSVNKTQSKSSEIAKQRAEEQARHIAAMNTEREAAARLMVAQREKNNVTADARRKMAEMRLETMRTNAATKASVKNQKEASRALKERQREMKRTISVMRDLGQKSKQVGNWMMTRVALPLVGLGAAAYRQSNLFNKSMAQVGTLIPGQTEKLKRYKKEVLDMSVEYGRMGGDISAGLYQDISNMGDAADTMKKLDVVMRASVAGTAQSADAMNLLSGVSADFGDISSGMMQKVSDLAFKTVELGSTTFPELAQEMGRTTTQATTLGITLEEMFGIYAGLTSGTVRTNKVATRFSGVMNALMRDSGRLADAFKDMGVMSGKELVQRFGGLQNAMFALKTSVGGTDEAFAALFEDQEARLAALALTGSKAKEVAREVAMMGDAAGSQERAFKEMTDGIGASAFRADQAKAKFARLSVEWGDKLIPLAEKLMDRADELVNWLSSLDDETINNAVNTGIWAIKIGLVAKALGGMLSFQGGMMQLASNIGGVGGQVNSVAGATGKLQTVIRGLGPAVTALVAGLSTGYAIWKWLESQQEKKTEQENLAVKAFGESFSGAKSISEMKKEREQIAKGAGFASSSDMITDKDEILKRDAEIQDERWRLKRIQLESVIRLNKAIEGKYKEQARITDMRNKWFAGKGGPEESADYFTGQTMFKVASSLLEQRQTPNRDVLEVKITTDGNASAEVTHEKKSGYSSVDTGSNF